VANKRIKDLPAATSTTTGDKIAIDGATTRGITVEDFFVAQLLMQTQQIITSGATVTVAAKDSLIAVNKTVGSATTVNLPAASSKVGAVKISDFKGDAGTNNITINVAGTDKLNGNLTSWTIGADGGSVVLTPLSDGSGYAV
jgi:hypothetical protein